MHLKLSHYLCAHHRAYIIHSRSFIDLIKVEGTRERMLLFLIAFKFTSKAEPPIAMSIFHKVDMARDINDAIQAVVSLERHGAEARADHSLK